MKQKYVKQILICLFIAILLYFFYFYKNKYEGLCNSTCNPDYDCSGTDLSNCLVGVKSVKFPEPKKCPEPVPADPIKCIADFGTSVGDPLCCGQEGVLQDTRYVCPNTLKKCSNFKCGSAFGTCVAN